MNKRGALIIISGPSGSGKGTVLKELVNINKKIFFSVSATTRPPRPEETEGMNYFFKTEEQFLNLIAKNEMLEYAKYCQYYYGTPKKSVEQKLDEGYDVILEIEVQGAAQIRASEVEAAFIFLMPPSFKELENRLRKRHTENEDVIKARLQTAADEIGQATKYDYIVMNDDCVKAAEDINSIITAHKLQTKFQRNLPKEVLSNA